MLSITWERILRVLEWLVFLFLCGVSIIFIKEIIIKFYSEDSSFIISEEYPTEHPTITICNLFKQNIDYKHGQDYEIIDSSRNDTIILGTYTLLGVKIRNLKVDFKTEGTWRRVAQ